ncbi:MAG: matrixin family metalloprotease [Gemmatimonadales bacterium]
MSRLFLALVAICVALLVQARWTRRPIQLPQAPTVVAEATSSSVAPGGPLPTPLRDAVPGTVSHGRDASIPVPVSTPILAQRALLEARRRFHYSVRATYLDSAFTSPDSVLRRWPDGATIRVALAPDSATPEGIAAVGAAMRSWESLGAGIRFITVTDTASADLRVRWVERFDPEAADSARSGVSRTGWAEMHGDGQGVIVGATVTLARLHQTRVLEPEELQAVAVHELGHVLGLPHSPNRRDVMYPTVQVAGPSSRDRASVLLLYALPPGPLRIP